MKKIILSIIAFAIMTNVFAQSILLTPNQVDSKQSSSVDNVILRGTNPPNIVGIRHGGTIAAPTATTSGSIPLSINAKGYNGTAFTSETGTIRFVSTESYTSTALGTRIDFMTVANGTTSLSTKMTILGDGNVGIGTASPLTTLNIAGGNWDLATTNGDFAIGNSTYKLKFGVATGGGGAGDARIYTTGGTHRTIFGSNTTDIMTVTPTGVGIGTITPSTGLQVEGTTSNQTEVNINAPNTAIATLSFARAAGSLATPTATASAYNLGWINFNGYNGTSFQTSSSIRSLTTELWSSTGRGSYLSFYTTNAGTTSMIERLRIDDNGNVGIGTSTPDNKLDVLGIIRANEVIVETGWADYVFQDDYKLKPLSEVEAFIKENKHLPSLPSATKIQEKGAHVAELMTKMMEKIEELTLYSIGQKKEIDELKRRLDEKK